MKKKFFAIFYSLQCDTAWERADQETNLKLFSAFKHNEHSELLPNQTFSSSSYAKLLHIAHTKATAHTITAYIISIHTYMFITCMIYIPKSCIVCIGERGAAMEDIIMGICPVVISYQPTVSAFTVYSMIYIIVIHIIPQRCSHRYNHQRQLSLVGKSPYCCSI